MLRHENLRGAQTLNIRHNTNGRGSFRLPHYFTSFPYAYKGREQHSPTGRVSAQCTRDRYKSTRSTQSSRVSVTGGKHEPPNFVEILPRPYSSTPLGLPADHLLAAFFPGSDERSMERR